MHHHRSGGDEAEIAARVDVLNMVPVGIALTHGHVDHVAALGRLKASYEARGYSLPVAIHGADRVYLGAAGMDIHRESLEFLDMDESGFFGPDSPELPRPDVRLKAGDKVFTMDLTVLETPGHTPGSVCFYSEREGVLFSGDTIFFDGVGRTDLPGATGRSSWRASPGPSWCCLPRRACFRATGPSRRSRGRNGAAPSCARRPPSRPGPAPRPAPVGEKPSPAAKKPVKKAPVRKAAKRKTAAAPSKKKTAAPAKRTVTKPAARGSAKPPAKKGRGK